MIPRKKILYLGLIFMVLSCSKDSLEDKAEDLILAVEEEEISINNEPLFSFEAIQTLNWLKSMQFQNGLMESASETNFVSLYDNSLAAIGFMATGQFSKAEKILDYFNARMDSELQSGSGGFYQFRDGLGENKQTIWLGDNAWLLIAINNYKELTGNSKYDKLGDALEKWIRSLQDEDGGLWGGRREDGSQIHKITEGIITAYNAVKGFDSFHEGILGYLKAQRWNENDKLLVAWPDNSSYYYAMDLHSLGYMVFNDFPLDALSKADRYMTSKISTVTGQQITGYCFDEDKDVIWLEGTAQMALAFLQSGNTIRYNEIITELELAAVASGDKISSLGLPYTANTGSCYGAVPLWEHADLTPALSSSVWYLFNLIDYNPLKVGRKSSVPESLKFWLK